jgi:leader peptidase (prepilin peptidase) / N-methyltransferase
VSPPRIIKIDEKRNSRLSYNSDVVTSHLIRRQGLNVATAALYGLAIWRIGLSPELPAVLAFIFGGVLLGAIDWRTRRLPTKVVYLTLAAVVTGLLCAALATRNWTALATALAGGALFANAMYLLWFFTNRFSGMVVIGLGDVRLAALLGVLLGWYGLPNVLFGAIAGHVLALVVVIATCIWTRTLHLNYAFGPPLIAGTLVVVLAQA